MLIHAKVAIVCSLVAACSLFAARDAQAQTSQFNLTYSGPTVGGNILLTATPIGDGTFIVTAASGSQADNGGTLTVAGVVAPTASYGTPSRFYIGDTSSYFGYDDVLTPATSPVLDGLLLTFNGEPDPVLIFYDSSGKDGDGIGYQISFYVESDGNDALDPAFADYPITMLTLTPVVPPVAAVEFTQAIQQYQTLSDLETSLQTTGEPPVPIIAGKPAAMRIYFNSVTDATDLTVTAGSTFTGTKTISLQPGCAPADQRIRNHGCDSLDFYLDSPPAGPWIETLTVTDSLGNQLETETLNLKSRTTSNLVLASVKGCGLSPFGGQQKLCGEPDNLEELSDVLELLAPVSDVSFGDTKTTLEDYSDSFITWEQAIFPQLKDLYTGQDQIDDDTNQTYKDYVLLLDPGSPDSSGTSDINQHSVVTSSDPTSLGSHVLLAHEVGHTLSLRHTNRTLPSCALAKDKDAYWPFPDNYIQSSLGTYEYGYDTDTETVEPTNMGPPGIFDLMSYCSTKWVSPLSYDLMIEKLGGGAVNAAAPVEGTRKASAAFAPRPRPEDALPTPVEGQYWQISGSIDPVNGLAFDPVFQQTFAGTTAAGTGTYSIEVLGAANQVLYTRYFTPDTLQIDGNDDNTYLTAPLFSEWIPVTAGAASLIVLDSNSNRIGTLPITGPAPVATARPSTAPVGGVAPVVTITSPSAGFVGTGPQTISWTAQEPNVTNSTSRMLYSPDGGTMWYEEGDTTNTSDTIDFSDLPGSTNALIEILVSDGINTGSAISAPFTVPKHLPSSVVITNPPSGYAQASADPVSLKGGAFDADDGFLTGAALTWKSDIQGALGTGSPLSVNLNPGTHNVTLTATDSDGNSISASVSILIGGGRPALTLSTSSLRTNCTSASIGALPGNQGAPLATVEYSLDGGTTYTSIPLAQLPYSFVVPGSGSINLVARATDLSHQITARSTRLTLAGTCTTGVPSVSGGSTQVATVDAAFSTPLSVLVTNNVGNPEPGVAVNFTAPANGAGATVSSSTSTTNASGIASVGATANSDNGSYTVVASVPGFSTTAQFNLTNTDFSLALSVPSLAVENGESGTATITVTPLSGFNSSVVFACTGLPVGAACSFSPASVTPAGAALTSTVTLTTSPLYEAFTPGARGPLAPLPPWWIGLLAVAVSLAGLGIAGVERKPLRRWASLGALVLLIATASYLAGCLHNSPRAGLPGGTPTGAYSITVTATSGADVHSTTVVLTVL